MKPGGLGVDVREYPLAMRIAVNMVTLYTRVIEESNIC